MDNADRRRLHEISNHELVQILVELEQIESVFRGLENSPETKRCVQGITAQRQRLSDIQVDLKEISMRQK